MYEQKEAKRKKELLEWIKSLAIVIVVVLGAKAFVFGTVLIKGVSMEPTLYHGDFVFINKLGYKIGSPKVGDVVVCTYDKGTDYENIVKRVIALPGDVVEFQYDENYHALLYVNGELIEEEFIKEPIVQTGDTQYPYTVPENCYFVMGDNRNASNDSRSMLIGAVEKKEILGRVVIRLYPINAIKTF